MTDNNAGKTNGQNSKLSRRTALALMGTSTVGGAAATSAFSQLTADRPVDVEVVSGGDVETTAGSSVLEITNNAGQVIDASITADDSNAHALELIGSSSAAIAGESSWDLAGLEAGETAQIEFEHESSDTNVAFDVEAFSGTSGYSIGSTRSTTVSQTTVPSAVDTYIPFSDGEGTTLSNRRGDNGTINNAVWNSSSNAVGGNLLQFDGANNDDGTDTSVVFSGSVGDNTVDSDITITATFKHFDGNDGSNPTMVSYGSSKSWALEISDDDSGSHYLTWTFNAVERNLSSFEISPNTWYSAAIKYDATNNEVTFYLDDTSNTETKSMSDMQTQSGDLGVGMAVGGGRHFDGQIAELSLTNGLLSDSEIGDLLSRGSL